MSINLWLLIFFSGLIIVITIYKMSTHSNEPGEFSAIKNASYDIFGVLTLLIYSMILLIAFIALRKIKLSYLILIILLLLISIPVLNIFGDLNFTIFYFISEASPISLMSEIIPTILLLLTTLNAYFFIRDRK